MSKFYVYLIFRPNGIPCYVGKGKGRRSKIHATKNTNPHLNSIYRLNNGELPIVKIKEGLSEKEAFEIEKIFIRVIGREIHGGPLVNQTDGGEGVSGYKHTEETKLRMHSWEKGHEPWNKGNAWDEETKAKMREAKLGTKQSPEHRAAIGAAHKGRKRPPETGAKITAAKLGKKASEKTKAKLRQSNRSRDPEVRARIAAATRAAMARPEIKARLGRKRKLEDGIS